MILRKLLQPILSQRSRTPVRFELRYAPRDAKAIAVGVLTFERGRWTFQYQDEFKRHRTTLHPIEGFDDLDRVYESEVLFPFFAVRIPDIDRSDVKRALDQAQLTDPDLPDLLRMFGRRALSSPAFELVPV